MHALPRLLAAGALALLAAPFSHAQSISLACTGNGASLNLPVYAVDYDANYDSLAGGNIALVSVATDLTQTATLFAAEDQQTSYSSCTITGVGSSLTLTFTGATITTLFTEAYAQGLGDGSYNEITFTPTTVTVGGATSSLKKVTPEAAARLGTESRARLEAKLKQ